MATAQNTALVYVLSNTLKLLHPFMPFIAEEIWQALPHISESIMISSFPVFDEKFENARDRIQLIMESHRE